LYGRFAHSVVVWSFDRSTGRSCCCSSRGSSGTWWSPFSSSLARSLTSTEPPAHDSHITPPRTSTRVHSLLVLNFYPYLQKYITPSRKDVTQLLAALVQACHDHVPPDALQPVMRQLVDQFVHDRARPEVITVGIKTVREICVRAPLVMNQELLVRYMKMTRRRARAGKSHESYWRGRRCRRTSLTSPSGTDGSNPARSSRWTSAARRRGEGLMHRPARRRHRPPPRPRPPACLTANTNAVHRRSSRQGSGTDT